MSCKRCKWGHYPKFAEREHTCDLAPKPEVWDGIEGPHGPCMNCKTRPAVHTWAGDGGVMGWVHGAYWYWCKVCVLEAQIEHAEKAAARLAELRSDLQTALSDTPNEIPVPCTRSCCVRRLPYELSDEVSGE